MISNCAGPGDSVASVCPFSRSRPGGCCLWRLSQSLYTPRPSGPGTLPSVSCSVVCTKDGAGSAVMVAGGDLSGEALGDPGPGVRIPAPSWTSLLSCS